MLSRLSSALVLSTLLAGTCGPQPQPQSQCPKGYLGQSGDTQLEVWARGTQGELIPVSDGASVPMQFAPQGGFVAFIGARAHNIDSCGVTLTASVKDLSTGQVRLDGRTINLDPDGTGWGQSNIEQIAFMANVPLCPNEWSASDLFAVPYGLTVSVEDAQGHQATQTFQVHLTCPDEFPECRCQCKAGYILGEACGAGGGPSGADGG